MPYSQRQANENVEMTLDVNDNANFTFTVSTADPVALRTFIMQGFDLSFSGIYDYTIKVPSAKDVEKQIKHHPGEIKATMEEEDPNQEKRPDIRPVIEALNNKDVFLYIKGKKAGKVSSFNIDVDPETGVIKYVIKLPNIYAMDLPINVGLTSRRVVQSDEFDVQQASNNESDRPQPFGVGQQPSSNDNQRDMSLFFTFDKPGQQSQQQRQYHQPQPYMPPQQPNGPRQPMPGALGY